MADDEDEDEAPLPTAVLIVTFIAVRVVSLPPLGARRRHTTKKSSYFGSRLISKIRGVWYRPEPNSAELHKRLIPVVLV